MKTKIWALSDTHGTHRQAIIPEGIDLFIFAGDSTNYRDLHNNLPEFEDFFNWIVNLDIKYKVIIAGNHDAWATKKYNIEKLEEAGIIYLEDDYTFVNDIKIWGSPWTPTFGTWHFMKDRAKIDRNWEHMDHDIDILVTHGPPKSILDLTENRDYQLEQCGDSALYKRVRERNIKYHIFGHVHDFKSCLNFGQYKSDFGTTFMNVSSVEDGKIGVLKHNGIVFEYDK